LVLPKYSSSFNSGIKYLQISALVRQSIKVEKAAMCQSHIDPGLLQSSVIYAHSYLSILRTSSGDRSLTR
jgi:hypothetical protein